MGNYDRATGSDGSQSATQEFDSEESVLEPRRQFADHSAFQHSEHGWRSDFGTQPKGTGVTVSCGTKSALRRAAPHRCRESRSDSINESIFYFCLDSANRFAHRVLARTSFTNDPSSTCAQGAIACADVGSCDLCFVRLASQRFRQFVRSLKSYNKSLTHRDSLKCRFQASRTIRPRVPIFEVFHG